PVPGPGARARRAGPARPRVRAGARALRRGARGGRAAPGRHRAGPPARGAAGAGRLDGRGQRAPGPGRDACPGVRTEPRDQDRPAVTRRHFFRETGFGIGALALAALLERDLAAAPPTGDRAPAGGPVAPRPPHFAPRAKTIIYLFMAGGPS